MNLSIKEATTVKDIVFLLLCVLVHFLPGAIGLV